LEWAAFEKKFEGKKGKHGRKMMKKEEESIQGIIK
jgi:hypothetical protein